MSDQDQTVYTALILVQDDGTLAECAAIKHKGGFWLVPQWLDSPSEQTTSPERIIGLAAASVQPGGRRGGRDFDLLVNDPIPIAVLYGPNPTQAAGSFVVEMAPAIVFSRRSAY